MENHNEERQAIADAIDARAGKIAGAATVLLAAGIFGVAWNGIHSAVDVMYFIAIAVVGGMAVFNHLRSTGYKMCGLYDGGDVGRGFKILVERLQHKN